MPVDRVGLYVPGGLAVYPSSVIMNVVPAQLAEVGSLAVASPPQRENVGEFAGYPNPTILAACALLGVDEVYAVGGAQAVAMFAHGFVDDDPQWGEVDGEPVVCDPVSLVTGPGNIWVVAAKRLLKGLIGIDAEAGPTEIAILADDSADPDHVAADLVSQAEHDPLAASVLVTDSEELAEETRRSLARRVPATKHSERVTEALEGTQSRIVLVDDVDAGLDVVNAYAAEHLEIQTRDAAGRRRPRAQRGCRLRRSAQPGQPRRLRRRLQPRAAHRRVRVPLAAACRCSPSCAASTSSTTTSPPCAMSPATS